MLWWTLYNAQSAMLDDTCYGVMTFTMMCTSYMHITCWWWWWVFDDDVSTYPMTLKYNLWWYSALVKQKYFSNCEWQWTVCTSRFRDWYVTDLTGSQVRHISSENRFWCLQVHRFGISAVSTGFGVWQVHRFGISAVSTGFGIWQVHRFSISAVSTGFGIWQVHRFGNILLIRVAGRGKERRS